MATPARLDDALRLARQNLLDCGVPFALVGGLAVTVRTRPRFTEDIDFALAVDADAEAEQLVHGLVGSGYRIEAAVEHQSTGRLATIRLVRPEQDRILVDLLFASSGIEQEVVAEATTVKVFEEHLKVATVGHLIAMKVLSNEEYRPHDSQDLVNLFDAATARDFEQAREALRLIEKRGYARDKNLLAELDRLQGSQ